MHFIPTLTPFLASGREAPPGARTAESARPEQGVSTARTRRSALRSLRFPGAVFLCTSVLLFVITARSAPVPVGVARKDVTPSVPIRLTGYAIRAAPSVGVEQKL